MAMGMHQHFLQIGLRAWIVIEPEFDDSFREQTHPS